MRWLFVVCAVTAACGDNALPRAPAELRAGPVTIDTQTMTLRLDGDVPLEQAQFLSIGTVSDGLDEAQYYDPRGDAAVTLAPVPRATALDAGWVLLEGGARMQLTPCPRGDCAMLDIDASSVPDAAHVQIALPRGVDEPLYGTGDAPLRANVAGTVREMALRLDLASDSSLNETHVPVPLVLWPRRNAAMFIADDRPGALDLGAADPERVTATFNLPARGALRVYLYTASTPLDLVRQYVDLTTRPAVPPRWAFAPQQWRNVHDATSELLDDAQQMRARDIPGSVMWIDNPWQTAYNDFTIDELRFEGIDAAIAALTAQGYKVVFWSTPYVGKEPSLAADRAEGAARELFVTSDTGGVVDWPWQNGPGALVDFTRDGAKDWWRERIRRVVERGAAGFKLDFGEDLVPDIAGVIVESRLAAGDNSTLHNRYAEGYHDAYLGAFPPGEGFLITRAGAWGEQHVNTAIWPGDLDSDMGDHGVINADGKAAVGGLPSAIARGLGLAVSGYPFYGSDIGGFLNRPNTETLLRWAQYAALGTIMQLGGGGPSHNPWDTEQFSAEAAAIYKRYADLHMQLNPLLWTLAQRSGIDGTPITRPARFVYDCACDDAMFLLGDDILVAPVIEPGATTRTLTLPPGTWIERATGTAHAGGSTITVAAPLAELPLFHRVASLVPMFARYADTLLPVTAAGVTTYADPLLGRELRLVYTPGETTALAQLHDGALATAIGDHAAVTGGSEYSVFTLDVDGRAATGPLATPTQVTVNGAALLQVASQAALEACAAPGCWLTAAQRTQVRVFAPEGATRAIELR